MLRRSLEYFELFCFIFVLINYLKNGSLRDSMISKEVLVTTGIFVAILMLGMGLLDSLYQPDNYVRITAAATADNLTNTSENSLTGAVVGTAGIASSGSVIGSYAAYPHFKVATSFNLDADYDTFKSTVRVFYSDVSACVQSQSASNVESCIQRVLLQKHPDWDRDAYCETSEETLFYDVTETFSQCFASSSDDCVCGMHLSRGAHYPEGKHVLHFSTDDYAILFSYDTLGYTLSGTPLLIGTYDDLTQSVVADPIGDLIFEVDVDSGVATGPGFSYLQDGPVIYLYKQHDLLYLVSEADMQVLSEFKAQCALPEPTISKFCYEAKGSDGTLQRSTFALDFSPLMEQHSSV